MNATPTVRGLIMELLKYPLDATVVIGNEKVTEASPLFSIEVGAYSAGLSHVGDFFSDGSRVHRDNMVRAVCLRSVE